MSSINSKAVGADDLSRSMIMNIIDVVLPIITHLINFSLTHGVFPSYWKKAFVRPLSKVSNPSLLSQYRPISILPYLSKILEAVVHRQFSDYLFNNNLLSAYQSGFRPGHSTTSALLKVTDDIRAGMEASKVTVLSLIDFSNAFNAVDYDILLAILSYINIPKDALSWFSSYLRGRQQAIRHGSTVSDWCDLSAGVPQGGILSALLFSVFIKMLTKLLRCSYHLYADDLQIYSQSTADDISSAIHSVNEDMQCISDWSDRFGIAVNPNKCQAIVLGSSWHLSNIDLNSVPPVLYRGNTVKFCTSVKNLGLHLDSTLSWIKQIDEVSRKVINTLRCLYRHKNFLPHTVKIDLVRSLCLPIIDYADVCYLDLNADLLNKLDRLLNRCIRFIFNLRKYDHVSDSRRDLNWLPIRQRRDSRILCFLFTILKNSSAPAYLKDNFTFLSNTHDRDLRSADNLLLAIPRHRSGFFTDSFTVHAARLWDALPVDIRQAPSRLSFKKMLHSHLSAARV